MGDDTFIWTLAHIRALLWIYYSPHPLPNNEGDIDTARLLKDLSSVGLIDHAMGRYETTERARVYCEAIRNVELPIQEWVMP